MGINRIILVKKLNDFKNKLNKTRFTSVEFIDYLESEGYTLDERDRRIVMHWLSANLPSHKIEILEVDRDKTQSRKINEYLW